MAQISRAAVLPSVTSPTADSKLGPAVRGRERGRAEVASATRKAASRAECTASRETDAAQDRASDTKEANPRGAGAGSRP